MTLRKEKRLKREVLTRAVSRMCVRLDEENRRRVSFRDRFFNREEHAVVRVTELWAFGSYARRVAQCGDLDLLARVVIEEGRQPLDASLNRVFFRSPANVHTIFDPDPAACLQRMSDESAAASAVLVWREGEGPAEWQARLSTLAVADPSATRYARELDELPFRPEMLYPHTDLEKILSAYRQGKVEWEFHEFTEPTDLGSLRDDEAEIHWFVTNFGSAKLKKLLPFLFAHVRQYHAAQRWSRKKTDGLEYEVGSAFLITGRPYVPIGWLEEPEYSALIIAPYLSGRGPNGVWTIRRAAEHPLVKLFANAHAYYFATSNGTPETVSYSVDDHPEGVAVELFRSRREADRERKHFDDEDRLLIADTTGVEILSLLHGADVAITPHQDFILTRHGYRVINGGWVPDQFRSEVALLAEYLLQRRRRR